MIKKIKLTRLQWEIHIILAFIYNFGAFFVIGNRDLRFWYMWICTMLTLANTLYLCHRSNKLSMKTGDEPDYDIILVPVIIYIILWNIAIELPPIIHYNAAPYTLVHIITLSISYIIQRFLIDKADKTCEETRAMNMIDHMDIRELFEDELLFDMAAYIHLQKAILDKSLCSLQDFPYPWRKTRLKSRLEKSGACNYYLMPWMTHIKDCKAKYYNDTVPHQLSYLLFLIDAAISMKYWQDHSNNAFLISDLKTFNSEFISLIKECFTEHVTKDMVLKDILENGFTEEGAYYKAVIRLFETISDSYYC